MIEIGAIKYQFRKRLGDSHRDLALCLGIPRKDRDRWESGDECEEILEWLKNRDRLDELPKALLEIEREDLVPIIEETQFSNSLNKFFDEPPTKAADQNLDENAITAFFQGYSDSWKPIQAEVALSRRLRQKGGGFLNAENFVEELFSNSLPRFVKIFGAGGSGKTTFSKMLALKLDDHSLSPVVLLRNFEQQRIPKDEVQSLAQELSKDNRKLFLIYDNPVASQQVRESLDLINSLQDASNTIVIILEREDEWLAAYAQARGRSQHGEQTYFLEEQLRGEDIEQLCRTIEKLQSELSNSRILVGRRDINDFRRSLIQGNQHILLVAMYEATTGEKFEETIINEFDGIPDENAKRLYEFICGMATYSIQFPYDLARVLYTTGQLRDIKRQYLAGIVRQSRGVLFTRHKTIAEILWLERNPDVETEMDILVEFLLDLSYSPGHRVGIDLNQFSLQVFKLLTKHPKFKLVGLPYIGDVVDALSSVTGDRTTARLYSDAGQYFERNGQKLQAITVYEKAIRIEPRSDLFTLLGQVHLKLGHSSKAIAVLQEGIRRAPGPEVYTALGQALLRRENGLDQAIAILQEGIQRTPDPRVYTALSQALLRRENGLDQAIAILQEGIERAPGLDVFNALGKALLLKSKSNGFEDTLAIIRESFIKGRNLDKFCLIVARNLKEIDLCPFVRKYYSILIEFGKEKELLAFAQNLELHGQLELALDLLAQVKTQSADLLRAQGNCALSLELWGQATDYYLQAIKIAKANNIKAYVYNNLALVIRKSRSKSRYLEAIEYCNQAINLCSHSFLHPYENMAFFRIETSLVEEAESLCSEFKKTYNLGSKMLSEILQDIDDEEKFEVWSGLFNSAIPSKSKKRRNRKRKQGNGS